MLLEEELGSGARVLKGRLALTVDQLFFIIIRQPGCFLTVSCINIGRSEAPSNEESVCGVGVDRFTSASPQGGKGIVGRPVHYIKATGVVRLVVT